MRGLTTGLTRRWSALLVSVTLACLPVPSSAASGDGPEPGGEALKIKPPLPIWPSDYETIAERRPVFRINGRFQATRYRVELATDPDFTQPITFTEAKVTDTSGIAPVVLAPYQDEPLKDGKYYWRAFCGDDGDFWTPAANHRVFFVSENDHEAIVSPTEVVHPRLLLQREDAGPLLKRITESEHLRKGWQYQLNAAHGTLVLEPPDEAYAKAGEGQHGSYSSAAAWYHRHLQNLAFVAVVTHNRVFARKAAEMLMTACAYERWLGPYFDQPEKFNPPWHSALETAMMTEAVAVAYDLLYDQLTAKEREQVRASIAEKGIRPLVHDWADPIGSSQIPRHQLPTGNWVMVCAASAGVGALAILGEHPEAEQWVRRVRDRVRAWLHDRGGDYYVDNPYAHNRPDPIPVIGPSEPNFGVDGGYQESISYMNYAMRYVCFFADALHETTGQDLFVHVPEGVLDPLAWSVMAYPTDDGLKAWMVDFGDCWGGTSWYHDLLAALIKHRRDGRAAWLYRRIVPVPTTARSLLWYDASVLDAPPDAALPMHVFRTIGQVVMRRGWSPNTPMAAIKFHQNRGHLDIGTIYLFGSGHPTVIDSGPAYYGKKIYATYSSKSVAHNIVLVDDQPQVRTSGKMLAAVGTSQMTAAAGQLAAAYPKTLKSWTRDLIMLPGRQALVFDRLEGKGAHRFDLVLHPEAPFTMDGPGELAIGEGPDAARVTVFSDAPIKIAEQDGYYMTLPRKYVRYNAEEPSPRRSFLTLCQWPGRPNRRRPMLTVEAQGPGRWRLHQENTTARLTVRLGGASDDRIATDARVAAVWEPGQRGNRRHAILLDGKRLTVDGRQLLYAMRPVNAALEYEVPMRATFWAAEPTRVIMFVGDQTRVIQLNGQRMGGTRRKGMIAVDLPAGESELISSEFDGPMDRMPQLISDDLLALPAPDALAYHPDVSTRASTSWSDVIDAIDGDTNTAWISLPGAPMPQWMEVALPEPESMRRVTVNTGLPCAGRVETWDEEERAWRSLGAFEVTAEGPSAQVEFDQRTCRRLRVIIERIDKANNAATVYSLRWDDKES